MTTTALPTTTTQLPTTTTQIPVTTTTQLPLTTTPEPVGHYTRMIPVVLVDDIIDDLTDSGIIPVV
jgi:hypothetical protein